jgi:quercetin dioxygenase-like cupin family protein
MKAFSLIFAGLLIAGAVAIAGAASSTIMFTPAQLHWVAGTGPAKGTSAATMVGDPAKSGSSIIRVKMPDGYVNQPHYHAQAEYITVIEGSLLFGMGDRVDRAKGTLLPTGSFIAVPAGVHHWSIAKGETIEQVGGQGPLNNIPIKKGAM